MDMYDNEDEYGWNRGELRAPDASILTITAPEDGRTLLSLEWDGSVTGEIEDASEAGRLFVEYLRENLVFHPSISVEQVKRGAYSAGIIQ